MKQVTELGKNVSIIEYSDLPFNISPKEMNKDLEELELPLLKSKRVVASISSKDNRQTKRSSKINNATDKLVQALKIKKIQTFCQYNDKEKCNYIKLDWGVLGTIRVAEKLGQSEAPYKYNLIIESTTGSIDLSKGIIREFYTLKELNALIESIEIEREEKQYKYGAANYQKYMKENKKKFVDTKK